MYQLSIRVKGVELNLKYLLLGVILAPIFESVIEIILTALEAIKGKLSITVAKYNEQLPKMCNTNDNT